MTLLKRIWDSELIKYIRVFNAIKKLGYEVINTNNVVNPKTPEEQRMLYNLENLKYIFRLITSPRHSFRISDNAFDILYRTVVEVIVKGISSSRSEKRYLSILMDDMNSQLKILRYILNHQQSYPEFNKQELVERVKSIEKFLQEPRFQGVKPSQNDMKKMFSEVALILNSPRYEDYYIEIYKNTSLRTHPTSNVLGFNQITKSRTYTRNILNGLVLLYIQFICEEYKLGFSDRIAKLQQLVT